MPAPAAGGRKRQRGGAGKGKGKAEQGAAAGDSAIPWLQELRDFLGEAPPAIAARLGALRPAIDAEIEAQRTAREAAKPRSAQLRALEVALAKKERARDVAVAEGARLRDQLASLEAAIAASDGEIARLRSDTEATRAELARAAQGLAEADEAGLEALCPEVGGLRASSGPDVAGEIAAIERRLQASKALARAEAEQLVQRERARAQRQTPGMQVDGQGPATPGPTIEELAEEAIRLEEEGRQAELRRDAGGDGVGRGRSRSRPREAAEAATAGAAASAPRAGQQA